MDAPGPGPGPTRPCHVRTNWQASTKQTCLCLHLGSPSPPWPPSVILASTDGSAFALSKTLLRAWTTGRRTRACAEPGTCLAHIVSFGFWPPIFAYPSLSPMYRAATRHPLPSAPYRKLVIRIAFSFRAGVFRSIPAISRSLVGDHAAWTC